jgi:hypothetical protein
VAKSKKVYQQESFSHYVAGFRKIGLRLNVRIMGFLRIFLASTYFF